ncbi:MAG: hypothetical protein EA352_06645 [Gemmatimonadales bacterium]|nr:MAG: hypothetical protein EA352_06645 [Gemmatimonadales bacterium]
MGDRDDLVRTTPFEVGVPGGDFAEEEFRAIEEEVESRGADPRDPAGFLLLGQVGRLVRELRGEESGAEALHSFGAFLFHAWHFQRAGRPLYLLETQATRYLVESNPVPREWDRSLPHDAGYLQLPRHLFWTRPDPEGPAEALDGIFWVRTGGAASGGGDNLSLLLVAGMRRDRDGFSVVPLPPVPMADAPTWLEMTAREEGPDFESTLPGGELERLYSLETTGEVLKLVARALGYMATVPGAVTDPVSSGGEEGASALEARRIRLGGG